MDIRFDVYYRYEDLTGVLHELADAYPELVRLSSIGKSHEGRDLWLLEVTNAATGTGESKPALWVDGNIHANEVSGSSACLYLVNALVTQYGADPDITRCLDTRVFYVCPRLGPDGSELYLADKPRFIRSSTRPCRDPAETRGGLTREDMDGDGRILTMRVPDPNGAWKVCPEEPRLIMQRDPAETGGECYRLLWEGRIDDFDGWLIHLSKDTACLDLNRNYPMDWQPAGRPYANGRFPLSEPETRAAADFITGHPSITGAVSFHTWGGALLRPYGDRDDDVFPNADLAAYQQIGEKGAELTGYVPLSSRNYFGGGPRGGMQTSWLYDHLGTFAWTVELWSPYRLAGIESFDHRTWFRDHPLEDEIKLLKWSDEALGGEGYVDWYPFEHPQLGSVEIGGWDWEHFVSNPPPAFLEKEVAPFADWLVWHLLISPRLEILNAEAERLDADLYRVQVVFANTGWLPTQVTDKAVERGCAGCVHCDIELPEGAELVGGEARMELGQLKGRSHKPRYLGTAMGLDPTSDRCKAEWIVRGPAGTDVNLTVRHPRAGTAARSVTLPATND